jgi:ornithine carbamoyltransferase
MQEILAASLLRASPPIARSFAIPGQAVAGADVINVDVWASMGQEDQAEERLQVFSAYQLNDDLLAHGPAGGHRFALSPRSPRRGDHRRRARIARCVAFDQAENKMHIHKAILESLIG